LFCYFLKMAKNAPASSGSAPLLPWSTLRPVGNSLVVKLTIIIPVVGYLIIFNDKLAGYVDLISEVGGNDRLGLSVSPRLFQIYFGFCFVAIASAVYSLACPSIIKRYPSAIDLGAATTGSVGDYGYAIVEKEIFKSPFANEYKALKNHFESLVSENFSMEQAHFQVNNALINMYFALKNSEKPFCRWVCGMGYVIGFGILLITSAKIFYRVCLILWHVVANHGLFAVF
jgi:hypothetical protein